MRKYTLGNANLITNIIMAKYYGYNATSNSETIRWLSSIQGEYMVEILFQATYRVSSWVGGAFEDSNWWVARYCNCQSV